jgi:MFS family permease
VSLSLPLSRSTYGRFLLLISGLGGLLYGIDVGIIAAALLYLGKTISLSVAQTSAIVAAVLGGGVLSSLAGGLLADLYGRKRMMVFSGLTFLGSVGMIVLSQSFLPLLLGRLLQGMSGGIMGVVIPLYLAECLSAETRGRGTAIFQFMLTLGIVVAAFTGLFYTHRAESAIAAAHGSALLIRAAQNHAWRGMFFSILYPGILFTVGSAFLSESPRWLARKGQMEEARKALLQTATAEEAEREMSEMLAARSLSQSATATDSLLQRKYLVPFLLACAVLSLNQTTGINSILAYLVVILRQAGLSANHAVQGDVAVKVLNCVMTLVAVSLVDRKGRRFLLILGTCGVALALALGGLVFLHAESSLQDVTATVQGLVRRNLLTVSPNQIAALSAAKAQDSVLTVLYSAGGGEHIVTVRSSDFDPTLTIRPDSVEHGPLRIRRALDGPMPSAATGWLITSLLGLFIAAFAVGPGVVVWLMLSELMPTRIRATGMGVALLLNLAVSTLIADLFLPVVGHFGYSTIFFFWATCTLVYLGTAIFLLPETRGRTLEEIELYFARTKK